MAGRYDMASVMKKLTAMETDATSDGIHCTQKEKRKKNKKKKKRGNQLFIIVLYNKTIDAPKPA